MSKCSLFARMAVVGTLAGCIGSAQAALLLNEGFETVLPTGWTEQNNSSPAGTTGWFQGNSGIFSAQAGAGSSYAAANFESAAAGGNISNWLFTPVVTLSDGSVISFYTRSSGLLPDRLELRLSTSGASTDVGSTDSSVGDFTTLLITINPALASGGYPDDWTQFTATLSGVGTGGSGRLAFRYLVTDTNSNADYIGIDTVQLTGTVPEPSTPLSMALASILLGWHLRQRARQ